MTRITRRLRRSVEKNGPEVRAMIDGTMPRFVLRGGGGGPVEETPVFTFHAVDPEPFEAQLRFLRDNEYPTAFSAARRESSERDDRAVTLTFDDADWTFWAHAFPLLKRYGFSATLFVVPGLVDDADAVRPTLDDVRAGRMAASELARTGGPDDVCTWPEIRAMHESGLVNVQSHSMTHACVPTGPRLVDYVRPGLGYEGYKWVNVPISVHDDEAAPDRTPRWGAPIFESAPRLAARRRFVENAELADHMIALAKTAADPRELDDAAWRHKLESLGESWPPDRRGAFEPAEATEAALRRELVDSKRELERRLGKPVDEFCYPWFAGSERADRLAAEAGYRAVHYGIDAPRAAHPDIIRVRRISEHFLRRLPGRGRASLWSIFTARLHGART